VGLLAPLAGVLLFGLAVAAGSLLAPGSALADTALFRVEQRWHTFPSPAVTPGGAGMDQGYLQPGTTRTNMGEYLYPPPTAKVAPGNPIGGAFTLPTGFLDFSVVDTLTSWPGYTTTYHYIGYNGPGKFQPNFGSTASNLRLVFPTTGGNPTPNFGLGSPLTPTTTFSGRYDMSREGSIRVTPGPRRFGGTFRLFFAPEAGWKQYIDYWNKPPRSALYQGYGYYLCFDDGMYDCTPDTFVSEPGTTANYLGVRWLLTEKGKAKATTPTAPRASTQPTPTPYGNASYLRSSRHYLNLIHPWTTGFAAADKPRVGTAGNYFPQASGYDTSLGGVDITVTHYDWNQHFNKTHETLYTTTQTTKQYLKGVTRVVSMVRPRVTWTFAVPLDPSVNSIENIWNPVRLRRLTVFFLPEPAGMLMLGAGIAALLGLSCMRRH
jgi:hypothetical protein